MCTYHLIIVMFFFSCSIFSQEYLLEYSFADMLSGKSSSSLIVKGDEAVFKVNNNDPNAKTSVEATTKTGMAFNVKRQNNDELSIFSYSNQDDVFVRIPYTKGKEKEFVYKFDSGHLDWQIINETRQINKYNCQKATLELHGRYYEVWFTTEVPVKFGPFRLNGLPGMIVEVNIFLDKQNKPIRKWELMSVSNKSKNEVFSFHKEFFTNNKVMDYPIYEEAASEAMLDLKRKKLAKLAALEAKWAKEKGYSSGANVKYGRDFFTGYLFDIPEGIKERLNKLN